MAVIQTTPYSTVIPDKVYCRVSWVTPGCLVRVNLSSRSVHKTPYTSNDLEEWQAAIEEYEARHGKKESPQYPLGTVAL